MKVQSAKKRMSSAKVRKENNQSLAVSEATHDMVQGLAGMMGVSQSEVMRRAIKVLRTKEWKPGTRGPSRTVIMTFTTERIDGEFLDQLSETTGLSRSELLRQGIEAIDRTRCRRLVEIGKAKLEARSGALEPDEDPIDDGGCARSIKLLWTRLGRHRIDAEYTELRKIDAVAADALSAAIRQVTRDLRESAGRRLLREQKLSGTAYEIALPSVPYDLVYEFLDEGLVVLGVFPRLWK